MDDADRRAMETLLERPELWEKDSIYPGSMVLNEEGRAERDSLARQLRSGGLSGAVAGGPKLR